MRLLATLLLFVSACDSDLAPASRIDDLRVIAIAADRPELLYHGTQATERVIFSALAINPTGRPVTYRWSFCPVESEQLCDDYDAFLLGVSSDERAALDASRGQSLAGVVDVVEADAPVPIPPFEVDVEAAVFAYHLRASLLGLGTGAWPTVVLEVDDGVRTLRSQKRLTLNMADPRAFSDEIEKALGLPVCEGGVTDSCLALTPRSANSNPLVEGFGAAPGASADGEFAPVAAAPFPVEFGEELRIEPELAPSSFEVHEIVRQGVQADRPEVEIRSEEIVVSWFCTAGELGDRRTQPVWTKTYDTSFTAPDDSASTSALSIYAVARDQRGGVSWNRLSISLTP